MPLAKALSAQDSTYIPQVQQYLDLRRSMMDYGLDVPQQADGSYQDAYLKQQQQALQGIQKPVVADIGLDRWQNILNAIIAGRK